MSKLFSDDEGSDGNGHQIAINEHYAKAFEYRKEREELERLKAKYGSDYDPDGSGSDISTDSESAESEDEDGEELTPAVDAAILRTLARIRKKDPEIYNSNKNIYGEEQEKLVAKTTGINHDRIKAKEKSKPVTVRQANLEAMLNPSRSPSPEPLTHVQEQEALRKQTIAAFHSAVDHAEDDFLVPREKTKDEQEQEEEEYRAFLQREVGDLRDLVSVDGHSEEEGQAEDAAVSSPMKEEGDGKKKKKRKSKKPGKEEPKEKKSQGEKDQEFLMNYILNRGWIDRSTGHVPTYGEVTSPTAERRKKKRKSKAQPQADEDDNHSLNLQGGGEAEESDTGLLSDTSFESLASHFEASYNHRFEEPGAGTIPSFPRNLASTVRRQDTTRKEARERRKQRKEEELQKKREEVKRLKALKMREVKRKLELIGRQGGLKLEKDEEGGDIVDDALKALDLEGEWDSEKHDRQMAGLFDRGADAYEGESDDGEVDDDVQYDAEGKPTWDDDIDMGNIPISDDEDIAFGGESSQSKKEKKKKKKKKRDEDENQGAVDIDAMDADVVPEYREDEEWDGTEEMRKRKLNEYMDEVYGLEFNDMVGDLPTRFKYVPVQPQGYALTPVEILLATDQELNEYMSVKKYAPYRQDKGNYAWQKKNQEKLQDLKGKLSERAGNRFGSGGGAAAQREDRETPKKRKGKKERMKLKAAQGEDEVEVPLENGTPNGQTPLEDTSHKSKKRIHKEALEAHKPTDGDEGEDEPKKKKRRHRKKGTDTQATQS